MSSRQEEACIAAHGVADEGTSVDTLGIEDSQEIAREVPRMEILGGTCRAPKTAMIEDHHSKSSGEVRHLLPPTEPVTA